jgi:hypothetical protein
MSCDQELPSPTRAKHLDSDKDWRHNHSVNSVYADGVDRMKIRQRLAIRRTEGNVSAKLLYRTTRFHASHDVPLGQGLVFETDLGLDVNSHLFQPPQHSPRQCKATTRKQVLLCFHGNAPSSS